MTILKEVFGGSLKTKKLLSGPVAVLLATLGALHAADVANLRCEYRNNPLGIDVAGPRLSWVIDEGSQKSEARGQRQTAYQVLVASSEELLKNDKGDLWESGKEESAQSVAVAYAGVPLTSGKKCFWKVRVWTTQDSGLKPRDSKASAWSQAASFVTGKLNQEDWHGKWIGAAEVERKNAHGAIYLQKEFLCDKPVKGATVFFCGLGFSELYINGNKVGDYVIGPGFTTYDKRVQHLVFDVTGLLAERGNKKLDVILADGWYALEKDPWVHNFHTKPYIDKPKLLLNLHVEYQDGSEAVVVSDESWKWSEGEITRSWIAVEDIDLREAGESRRTWRPVAVVKGPEGRLVCQKEPFCKVVEKVNPVSMTYDSKAGTAVWDLGREINGWVRFSAAGPSGSVINVTTVPENLAKRTSRFTLSGSGVKEVYEPRFFYVGIRKVEVSGLVEAPATNDVTGCLVSSMYVPSGGFRCSDESITALHDAVRRTVVSYTTFLPNDPVREWKAWTQDVENMFWSAVYLFDSRTMYERWQWDLLDGQAQDGNCPNIAPGPGYDGYNSPWWGGCVVWLPWEWYLYYGDDTLLRQSYPAMKRYVDYLGKAGGGPLQCWGLLDWLPVEETPQAIINTPAYYLYAQIVAKTAAMLGKQDEAKEYEIIAGKVKDKFNSEFLDPATGIYGQRGWKVKCGNWAPPVPLEKLHEVWWGGDRPCTQAGQVLPLALGMVPAENRAAVEKALLKEISAHHNRLSTGFVSTPYLLKVLADLDPEAGWKMTSTKEFPSWYYMTFGKGGDLMKETWAGGQALMPSLGGNIAAWHVESLGGIRPDPSGPGFKKIIIKPNIVGDLRWVECWHDSNYGRIVSNWKREGGKLQMDIRVPANTTATVYMPAKNAAAVTEGGSTIDKVKGVKFLRMESGAAVYEVGSGTYRFESALPETIK